MTDAPETIGQRLRRLREARGLSANALALQAGVSQPVLWRIEAGQREPSLSAFAALCRALGVRWSDFEDCAPGE